MAFTYDDIISDARVDLKDTAAATWSAATMLKFANDVVQLARKAIARMNPEMIWTSKGINLELNNPGPYAISSDFESPVDLFDEYGKPVGRSYRGQYTVSQRSGKPDGYWIEGHAPANIYVTKMPNQAYAWTLYYIATVARAAGASTSIALPDFLREKMAVWLVKYAAENKEFETMSEDRKIALMERHLADILTARASDMELTISGVGF